MPKCFDCADMEKRINRLIGQMQGIHKMIQQDAPCENILIQVNAVKSAVHKVGQIILEGHLKSCVRNGIEHGDADKTIEDFMKAVEQFSKIG